MKKKYRKFRKGWRKWGASFLFFSLVISVIISWDIGVGICCLMMLTVPCGIKKVNTVKWIWYSRQLFFLLLAILNFIE